MKKLMILGASILQLPAIEKAVDMGLQVIARCILSLDPSLAYTLFCGVGHRTTLSCDPRALRLSPSAEVAVPAGS